MQHTHPAIGFILKSKNTWLERWHRNIEIMVEDPSLHTEPSAGQCNRGGQLKHGEKQTALQQGIYIKIVNLISSIAVFFPATLQCGSKLLHFVVIFNL